MKITKLDKVSLKAMDGPLSADLKALGEKYGLEFSLGRCVYSPMGESATYKLEVKVNDPALKLEAARAEFEANCRHIGIDWENPDESGLRPEDFGTEFVWGGTTYQLLGLYLRGRNSQKFPIKVGVVNDPIRGSKPGTLIMLPEKAVRVIRAATDASGKEIKPRPKPTLELVEPPARAAAGR